MKKTKIVCTVGPSCSDYDTLSKMVKEGMDVARLNFSHSTHKEHKKNIALIRRVSSDLKKCVSIIGDLQGPKIRVKKFIGGFAQITKGQEFTITMDNVIGDKHRVSTTFPKLPTLLKKGSRLLLDDGALQMRVKKVTKKEVICEVTIGGILKDNKGINLPGIVSDTDAVTKKDKEDLAFAMKNGVDFIAISFVRKAADVLGYAAAGNRSHARGRRDLHSPQVAA